VIRIACLLLVSAAAAAAAELAQHVFLFEPGEKELAVTESFLFKNAEKTAVHDPVAGAVRVRVPEAAGGTIQVTTAGPDGAPQQRAAEKTGKKDIYKVDFPIPPGESRIDVAYRLPFASPGKFSNRPLQKAAMTRLVAPPGVELVGQGLEMAGVEPRSQARIFNAAGGKFEVEIRGTGSIRMADAAEDEDSGPGIQQILPRLYDRAWAVIAIALAILALGFTMLYRRSPPPKAEAAPRGKRRQ
jgi:hypothetical protein